MQTTQRKVDFTVVFIIKDGIHKERQSAARLPTPAPILSHFNWFPSKVH